MRILMINVVCGIRSTGRICTDIAVALEKHGHEVKIAYGREFVPKQYQKYAVRIGTDFDVKMHGIRSKLFDAAGFGSREATRKFIDWIREWNPDVIHLHNIHGYYINVELLFNYLKICGKRIIWTLHDCWSFTGHCCYFDYAMCDKWKLGCTRCVQKCEYPSSYMDRSKINWNRKRKLFTSISNMTLVTPSNWLSNLVKLSYMNEYPIRVINNGIDIGVFKPTPSNIRKVYGIGEKKIILGVAAQWDRRKGLNYIADIASKIDDDYQVVVIGATQQQKSNLPNNITVIPQTNSTVELAEWYTAAEVFINPTLEDNYPTTNLESIACGTPVVTFNTGGSPESAVCYGRTVPKGNSTEMLKAIYELCKIREPMSINRSLFSKEQMVEKYLGLYFEGKV